MSLGLKSSSVVIQANVAVGNYRSTDGVIRGQCLLTACATSGRERRDVVPWSVAGRTNHSDHPEVS